MEVILQPEGLLYILPSAWRDWTGRVNRSFEFPRVEPDYGSLGQGDYTPSTLELWLPSNWPCGSEEGKPAGKLSFRGGLLSVQAALGNISYQAPADFEGYGLVKVGCSPCSPILNPVR